MGMAPALLEEITYPTQKVWKILKEKGVAL